MKPRARILVVDDSPDMTRVLADQLADVGYEVVLANSGADAIAALKAAPVDVLITDLRMEGVDGMDVLSHVREQHPTVPVLIMTAFGLVVAIPAVLGYNAVNRGNRRLLKHLNRFAHALHAWYLTGAKPEARHEL